MKLKFSVRTEGFDKIEQDLLDRADKAEVWLANEILKDTDPFVPMLTGSLSQRSHVEGKSVVYPGPYARYLYYGKVMKGPKYGPKYATDKDLVYTKSVHPNAQSHWFEASKAQNLPKWLRGVKKLVK
jgi:hypothetical protein